jgi:hypothetical protein
MGFHALADNSQAEAMTEVDNRAHDRGMGRADEHAGHECLVDLQLVDRERGEVPELRLPWAEVIEADANARVGQSREHAGRARRIGDQRRLRETARG